MKKCKENWSGEDHFRKLDDGILAAALQIRNKLGPKIIDESHTGRSLSVCMIVKDEEDHLARCLASLTPAAQEIIVVDTGSTDNTKDIARAFGAQVYDFEWSNDFSEARNFSLDKAMGEWVLVHDADEVLSPLDYTKLRNIISRASSEPLAYILTTRNYVINPNVDGWTGNIGEYAKEERGSGWFASDKVRLVPNDKRIRFRNAVHELLEPSIVKAGVKIQKCGIPIHHYGKLPSEKNPNKAHLYYELGIKKLASSKNNPVALREMAIQALELGKHEEAIGYWKEFLRFKPNSSKAYSSTASIYMTTGRLDDALSAARKAFELDPSSVSAMQTLATALILKDNPGEAITHLETILKNKEDYPPALAFLAAAQFVNNSREKGLFYLNKLVTMGYSCGPVFQSILETFIASGKVDVARRIFQYIKEGNHPLSEMEKLFG